MTPEAFSDRMKSSFPRKREPRASGAPVALDPRFRGGDEGYRSEPKTRLCRETKSVQLFDAVIAGEAKQSLREIASSPRCCAWRTPAVAGALQGGRTALPGFARGKV